MRSSSLRGPAWRRASRCRRAYSAPSRPRSRTRSSARFASPFARSGLLVLRDAPSPETEAGRRILETTVAAFGQSAAVTRTFSWLDLHDPYFVGRQGRGTFLVVGLDPAAGRADRLVPGLRRTAADLEKRLAAEAPASASF